MNDNRPIVGPLLVVLLTGGLSLLLLSAAFVVWLAIYFNSLVIPCLLVGIMWAVVAVTTYTVALRGAVNRLHAHLETTYEVTRIVKRALDWMTNWLQKV